VKSLKDAKTELQDKPSANACAAIWVSLSPIAGLVRAALSHLWFETLHPFDDGNGRIGRAVLQLALGQDMGQPGRIVTLSRQIESCKDQFYKELERAQRSNSMDVTAWVEWMLAPRVLRVA
jgi:Fic family protein